MSKKKRVRRDLDKFFRLGRYWDLLRLLENEGLVSTNAKEHREAWNILVKQAVKEQQTFREFCREVETLKVFPSDADFRLLMFLKAFIGGRDTEEELLQLKGLTPDAEKLRSNFTSCTFMCARLGKLRGLLEKFVREPDKITARYFDQVADFIPPGSLRTTVTHLGASIATARRFNQKAAVAKGWGGVDFRRLELLNSQLMRACQPLPEALQDVLLHPFMHNIAVMCLRLAPEANSHNAAHLLRTIPFLFRRLAGERAEEVERKLLDDRGAWMDGEGGDPGALARKLGGMTLEAKVVLLRSLRQRLCDGPSGKSPFDELDFFDDDDDEDDDFLEGENGDKRELTRTLLLLHGSILRDISLRSTELSPREKRELVSVMEPILFRDLDYVSEKMESAEVLQTFLSAIVDSGCGGTRMGLLALLAGAYYRNGDLRKRAERLLDETPSPAMEDMKWLAKEWIEFYYPTARTLKPILNRYRNDRQLMAPFVEHLCNTVESDLLDAMVKKEISRFPFALFERIGASKPKEPGLLRRELDDLLEYDELNLVRQYLRCYSDDILTREAYLCWLNAIHSSQPVEVVWDYASRDLKRCEGLGEDAQTLLPIRVFEKVLIDRIQAVLLFMMEHPEDLSTLSTDTLEPLLGTLFEYQEELLGHQTLLIRLDKILSERSLAGDEAVRPVMSEVRRLLQECARLDKKKARRTRKKTR